MYRQGTLCTARVLYVPPGYCMYLQGTVNTARVLHVPPGLTCKVPTFCPHSVFMCFVWISEQTAIISVYSINWLVCVTETVCVYCAVRTECVCVYIYMCVCVCVRALVCIQSKLRRRCVSNPLHCHIHPYTVWTSRSYPRQCCPLQHWGRNWCLLLESF